jgi:hypothetical protein
MAFSEYKGYSIDQLEQIFHIQTVRADLFTHLTSNDNKYLELQYTVDEIKSRLVLNEDANEATRSHLLVTPVVLNVCITKGIGAFFEPNIALDPEQTHDLPHQLNGKYDCVLTLHAYKFVMPIIAVVEVKPTQIGKGIGQCLAEMYATIKKFGQPKVYGIVTDGIEWEFYLLEHAVLSADKRGCYINDVSCIINRIEYIADQFVYGC